jgi:hypothetical protein
MNVKKKPAISNGFCTSPDFAGLCSGGGAGIHIDTYLIEYRRFIIIFFLPIPTNIPIKKALLFIFLHRNNHGRFQFQDSLLNRKRKRKYADT